MKSVTPHDVALDGHELQKGEFDPRVGDPPLTGSGGPDGFGYHWIDSDEAGGPGVFVGGDLRDRYAARHDRRLVHRVVAARLHALFLRQHYTSTHVSSNGFVSFTSPTGTHYTNGALPSATDPDDMVCAYWDDLNPSDGGTIYTYQDLANQRFIVQWNNVPRYGTGGGGSSRRSRSS